MKPKDARVFAKRKAMLGESFSTANYRLAKDLMFSLMGQAGHTQCYRCGGTLARDTFSIEHKEDWLDSDNPKVTFFDLDNIVFSHTACNYGAAAYKRRRGLMVGGIRTAVRDNYDPARRSRVYSSVKRKEKYLRLGT